jgi:hypothetical protein
MQRRQQQKSRTPIPLKKRKSSPLKPPSPPKPTPKMPKKLLTTGKQSGSKRSIPRHSYGNSLFHSVGELPLQNLELKERLLERAMRGGNCSSAQEESTRTRQQKHPNGEYFGTGHSILHHLESSKHSKHSKSSSKSKSASLIAKKMKQYLQLEAKHSSELEKIVGASPKEVRRLQKMHSLERLQAMEEVAKV